jgi:hypothetical protein
MSSEDITQKRHRHTRSAAAVSSGTTPSQHPHNPHHLNLQAHAQNTQTDMNYPAQPSTPPRTPRRDNRSASHNPNSNTNESGSKQKPRKKNRPKNVMTSPAVKGNDRNTPPLTRAQSAGMPSAAKPITTPSTAVYAGATFHASPAPSTLPIPSFYSKSVPDSPGGLKGLKSVQESPSTKQSQSPPLPEPNLGNQFQREESPLDFFFKADREEKARARSASSTNTAGAAAGPFQPPGASQNAQTPPAPNSQNRTRQGHTSKSSGSGMFAMELDGPYSPGTPYGPAFSTPYSERINAARSGHNLTREDSQQPVDRSEALKAYLFSGHTLSPPVTNGGGAPGSPSPSSPSASIGTTTSPALSSRSQQNGHLLNHDAKGSNNRPRPSGRSSGLRQEVTPTKTPTRTPDRTSFYDNSPTTSRMYGHISPSNQNDLTARFTSQSASPSPASPYGVSSGNGGADLQGMEDSLRKILKLDSARSSGAIDSGVAATTAMPNYAGGRVPPMSGMNHGVMGS